MKHKIANVVFIFAVAVPVAAASMCLFEEDPVTLKIRVQGCASSGVTAEILSGLKTEEYPDKTVHVFRGKDNAAPDCAAYTAGSETTVTVRRNCCDTPNTVCFFGWIES